VWRRPLEWLQTHYRSSVGSGVLGTIGFLAAAIVAVEISSHASVRDHSGNLSPREVLANTEMLFAPGVPTRVSVVPKQPRSVSTPRSQADPSGRYKATTNAKAESSLFSGETVSSKMLMMEFSVAPIVAAAPVAPVTPSAVTPRAKLKRQPTAQKPQAVEQPLQPKLAWWQRFPWLSLP